MKTKKIIVFIDSGDTIIDESTEVRDGRDIVQHAKVIEGADILLKKLKEERYRVALVANGYAESFENMYNKLDLKKYFEALIYSSDLGVAKPDEKMFQVALEKMNLTKKDCKNIIMVGNNLEKDIAGANAMGIRSVLLDWSPHYNMTPENKGETPDYVIHKPLQLLDLLKDLESKYEFN